MDALKKTLCPVCGYDLGFAAWVNNIPSDEICPCCGIQYGYDDAAGGDINKRNLLYEEWRKSWIKEGMMWQSIGMERSENWDPIMQLQNLKKK